MISISFNNLTYLAFSNCKHHHANETETKEPLPESKARRLMLITQGYLMPDFSAETGPLDVPKFSKGHAGQKTNT